MSGTVATVQPVALGTAMVTVTAQDPGGLTASLSFAVTVAGSPDLVASVSPDSVAVAPGGSFEYAVAVRNRGDVAAPATRVRWVGECVDSVEGESDTDNICLAMLKLAIFRPGSSGGCYSGPGTVLFGRASS